MSELPRFRSLFFILEPRRYNAIEVRCGRIPLERPV
jgi:hypothetical protein